MTIEEIRKFIDNRHYKWVNHLLPHIREFLIHNYPLTYIQEMLWEKHKIKISLVSLKKLKFQFEESKRVAKIKTVEEKVVMKPQGVGKEKNTIVVALPALMPKSINKEIINPDSIIMKGATISIEESAKNINDFNNKKPFDPFDAIIEMQKKRREAKEEAEEEAKRKID